MTTARTSRAHADADADATSCSPRRPDDIEHDVPAQRPAVAIAVDAVRVVNQRVPFTLDDELFGRADVLCEIAVGCDLPPEQRGIHMSRIEQALDVTAEQAATLPDVALLIAQRVQRTQSRPGAHARLTGDVVLRNRTSVTDLPSRDLITLTAAADLGPYPTLSLGLSATNMTACPCMQAYALDDLLAHFTPPTPDPAGAVGDSLPARELVRSAVPIATHSQKGRVTLTIEVPLPQPLTAGPRPENEPFDQPRTPDRTPGDRCGSRAVAAGLPTVTDLYRVLHSATTLTSELLKRPDEYDMVKRAHRRAQFVEDVARQTAATAAQLLAAADTAAVTVHASSYESIHGHDIDATLTSSLGALRNPRRS